MEFTIKQPMNTLGKQFCNRPLRSTDQKRIKMLTELPCATTSGSDSPEQASETCIQEETAIRRLLSDLAKRLWIADCCRIYAPKSATGVHLSPKKLLLHFRPYGFQQVMPDKRRVGILFIELGVSCWVKQLQDHFACCRVHKL